ncbi:HEAT repeat domain-containing protein [Prochlorococcus marinus]|uniref:HEAT repeat domain-containing protein n=1 Tax=Prochlorococcus marinus XMU1408 TaxID=2213228 RepID=A0A318RDY1_PROMR|nr:HEAT repeat domain-containing protein [Prochlorococcus marinus]MBW3042736.1 HEAT repeat domain-containing protein [Prochlorococcus marinus str. XMU1408]PYE01422.1 HEAT repeat domain-containing protein [Prochlorococcus marinus XMU1408]
MNQVFAGGLALIIAVILWSSKKQSKSSVFSQSQKDSFSDSTRISSLVQKKKLINYKKPESLKKLQSKPISNQASLNSIEIKKKITKLISSNPNDRLLAIELASQWKNKKAIPFLRRGLKDSDSRVVIASAFAISSYKGKTIDLEKKSQSSRPPRNVSLMR